MYPPFNITQVILNLVASVSIRIGQVSAYHLDRPSPTLRKQNRIRTIQASLQIEGNTLSEDQVTAILEKKKVIGPRKDIQEVINAIRVYEDLSAFDPNSEKSFLLAHSILMKGLVDDVGKYRKKGVGIMQGNKLAHMAPPARNVPSLMKELFAFAKNSKDLVLIKGCVFHYEMEFIHPFPDGNGRMGRLWQTLILSKQFPVFEFLPLETLISANQPEYYKALSDSDKNGNSTPFIEFMLKIIDDSLAELLNFRGRILTEMERLNYFKTLNISSFSRKEYMDVFRNISTATASRDLVKGVDTGRFRKEGEKNKMRYFIIQ